MKVNRKKLLNEIEEIIAYGCAYGEEVDVTTAKINTVIEPLVLAIEANKEYARLQIEKDRERVKERLSDFYTDLDMSFRVDETPIILD